MAYEGKETQQGLVGTAALGVGSVETGLTAWDLCSPSPERASVLGVSVLLLAQRSATANLKLFQ